MVTLKQYFWLIHLALMAVGAYIGADLFWGIVESRMETGSRAPTQSPSSTVQGQEKRSFQQYAVIVDRDLFGARGRPASPVSRPSVTASPRTPPTAAQNLKLVGTVVGSPEYTYAVIEDLSAKKQDLYRPGDLVREAKIVEISRNKVLLDTRGRREELLSFQQWDPASPRAEPAPREGIPPRRAPQPQEPAAREQAEEEETGGEIQKVGENMWRVGRDELADQLENLSQLLTEARLTPHFTSGQPDGLMVTNLPQNSFLERMGLRNGDILKGINGQKFNGLDEVLQAYQQLQSEPLLQIEVQRGDQTETLTYEIR